MDSGQLGAALRFSEGAAHSWHQQHQLTFLISPFHLNFAWADNTESKPCCQTAVERQGNTCFWPQLLFCKSAPGGITSVILLWLCIAAVKLSHFSCEICWEDSNKLKPSSSINRPCNLPVSYQLPCLQSIWPLCSNADKMALARGMADIQVASYTLFLYTWSQPSSDQTKVLLAANLPRPRGQVWVDAEGARRRCGQMPRTKPAQHWGDNLSRNTLTFSFLENVSLFWYIRLSPEKGHHILLH